VIEDKYGLLTPIKIIRKSSFVVEKIKSMILDNHYKPNDRLPSEHELAELLGVSRATIREAFHALELMGLIEVRPGSGTFVKNTNIFNVLGFSDSGLTMLLASNNFSHEEILEVRRILEFSIVDLIIKNAKPKELKNLQEIISEMAISIKNEIGFKSADMKLHRELAKISGNRLMEVLANSMYQLFWERFPFNHRTYSTNPSLANEIVNLHKEMVESLYNREMQKAKDLIIRHYKFAREIAKEYLDNINGISKLKR